jgi:hypothetical protein
MMRPFQALVAMVILGVAVTAAYAGVEATPYGYIKLDASYDSAMTNAGDYVYVVLPYVKGEEDPEFNMTAKQTRLGLKLKGGGTETVKLSGVFEMDFYGGGAENKPNPMMRKAYMEIKTDAVDILAGQTFDVISPLVPTTLNYIVLWKSGDIGYRRPQIRFTKAIEIYDDASINLQGSFNRSMGRGEDGEAAAMPSFQGRVAFATKVMGNMAEVGVAGLSGREKSTHADSLGQLTKYDLDQTAIAVDVSIPLGDMVVLKGQYFTGKNLAQYLGGVGQGIAEVPADDARNYEPVEIEASGWWAQLTAKPADEWQINVGAGSDDPEIPEGDIAGNQYEKNTTYYGNVLWNVAPAAVIGAEYSQIETEYVGGESYSDSRVQLSFISSF